MNKSKEKKNNKEPEVNPGQFWMSRLNTTNMYRSFTKGYNPWARSHAFTQPIQKTRGAYVFNQNAYNGNQAPRFDLPYKPTSHYTEELGFRKQFELGK